MPLDTRCSRSITRPPPCQEVTVSQLASEAVSRGDSLIVAATARFGAGVRSLNVTDALALLPLFIGIGKAMQNSATSAAAGRSQRGAAWRGSEPALRARPTKPPSTPPASAAAKPRTAAWGRIADGQGSGIQGGAHPRSAG